MCTAAKRRFTSFVHVQSRLTQPIKPVIWEPKNIYLYIWINFNSQVQNHPTVYIVHILSRLVHLNVDRWTTTCGLAKAAETHESFRGILKDLDAKIVHDLAKWPGWSGSKTVRVQHKTLVLSMFVPWMRQGKSCCLDDFKCHVGLSQELWTIIDAFPPGTPHIWRNRELMGCI